MKKFIPYLFLIGLLCSCKTADSFSIHKRKYNRGFYIEKIYPIENYYIASKVKKPIQGFDLHPEFQNNNNDCIVAASSVSEKFVNSKKKKIKRSKTTFLEIQNSTKVIQSCREIKKTINFSDSKRFKQQKSTKRKQAGIAFTSILSFIAIMLLASGFISALLGFYFIFFVGGFAFPLGIVFLFYGLISIVLGALLYLFSN